MLERWQWAAQAQLRRTDPMAQQRHTHQQTFDSFTAMATYHIQQLEREIQEEHIAQQCQAERRRTVSSVVDELWTWFRHHCLAYQWVPWRRPA
jgi:hypothetical protein